MSKAKNALVVGVGPGLGEAVARRLKADGYQVSLAARDAARLGPLAAELEGSAFALDATDPASIAAALEKHHQERGDLDAVIWNVGSGVFGDLEKVDLDAVDLALSTNTRGLFTLAKTLLPAMAKRGEGALIITGATASLRGKPFTTAFAAGKAAQRSLAQSLARQYGPQGVHVALIIVDGMVGAEAARERMPNHPHEGFIEPEGYADAVSFLLSQRRSAWTFELDIRPHVESW